MTELVEAGTSSVCVYCKAVLPVGATFCPACRLHQRRWKNWIASLGYAPAVMALVASAAVYVWTTVEEAFGEDRVRIVTYRNPGVSVFANTGSGDIFLLRVELPDPDPSIVRVDTTARRREIATLDRSQPGGIVPTSLVACASFQQPGIEVVYDAKSPEAQLLMGRAKPTLEFRRSTAELVYLSTKSGLEKRQAFEVIRFCAIAQPRPGMQ